MGEIIMLEHLMTEVQTTDGPGMLVGHMIDDGAITRLIVRFEGDWLPGDPRHKVIVAVEYEPDQVWTLIKHA